MLFLYALCACCVWCCVWWCVWGLFLSTFLERFDKDNEESAHLRSEKDPAMTPPPDPHLTYKYIYNVLTPERSASVRLHLTPLPVIFFEHLFGADANINA